VVTRVNSLGLPPGGSNNVSITTSSTTDRSFNNAFSASLQIASSSGGGNLGTVRSLPETGFAPGVVTDLSGMPQEEYSSTGELTLEIPGLGVKIPVVGVPLSDGAWNVSWLGKQAGWLQGTAFPSWNGNSVLTSHVYLSNGLPGPFVNLSKLKFGEKIIVHAYGQKYTFEVQTNAVLEPNDTTAFKHEERPWLTLVTCKEYDEKTNTYLKRVVVKAILVSVSAE
jgi:LPXTG-site transpeptidase (sortase) family protein